MEHYMVKGGTPLSGEVEIAGAKNAALPIIAASIRNVPLPPAEISAGPQI